MLFTRCQIDRVEAYCIPITAIILRLGHWEITLPGMGTRVAMMMNIEIMGIGRTKFLGKAWGCVQEEMVQVLIGASTQAKDKTHINRETPSLRSPVTRIIDW